MENETKEPRTRTKRASTPAADEARPGALEPLENFDPGEALGAVAEYAKENPHVALAAAAGVGFILGGGLTPRMLAGVAFFVGRRYANVAMRGALEGALFGQNKLADG
jgi:hypothetical protein